jgi:acetylornithine deacetylase/succinyl-diaminopimelate desuccinylase-like protein
VSTRSGSPLWSPVLAGEAIGYLRDLLRIDTTNPPGNETPAVDYLARILRDAGYDPVVIESAPGRGNLVVRYPGSGALPPLLLYAHVDVVTAEADYWTHEPFSGDLADGCIWGRGALDVKCMVAQGLMIMLQLQRSAARLRRDVIFAATADEEAGGKAGMGYLVDHHPDLIRAEYGLSEGGGTTTFLAGRALYDIRVAEKGTCRFVLRARGLPGHGSVPRPETAVTKIVEAAIRLSSTPLSFRALPILSPFFDLLARALNLPPAQRKIDEAHLERIARSLPTLAHYLHAITHDTAVVTGLHAGRKINVIPSEAEAWVDGRYLPGQTAEGFLAGIREIIGEGYDIVPVDVSPPLEEPPGGPLYDTILSVMSRQAPGIPVVPLLLSGATDAKHVTRLGTRCLGFGPVRVADNFPVEQLVHGHDERIPVDGYLWGAQVLYDIVREFCA